MAPHTNLLRCLRRLSTATKRPNLAIACPGQGILPQGSLYELRKHEKTMKPHLDELDEALQTNFSSFLLKSPPTEPDAWNLKTSNAQPAILASTYIIYQLFKSIYGIDLVRDSKTAYLLGHSLGEYTALVLGGVIDFDRAVKVVRARGQLMEELCEKNEYSMVVLAFRPTNFEKVQETAAEHNVLACVNTASSVSVSGTPQALETALAAMPKGAILKKIKLPVTIPFHNKILSELEPKLAAMGGSVSAPIKPIVSNYSGSESKGDCFENTVKDNSKPVFWKQSVDHVLENGVDAVVNMGPGKAIAAFNKRPGLKNHSLVTSEDMEALAGAWSEI